MRRRHTKKTDDGLAMSGLAVVCATCENDIDFPDDFADVGVCRHCGFAFLVDPLADEIRVLG